MSPATWRGLRCATASAAAALVICLGATRLSAAPVASSTPPPNPSGETSSAPQEAESSKGDAPTSPPPAEELGEPAKASESEAEARDSDRKRREEILTDQFEELSADAPRASDASSPEAGDEPQPPPPDPKSEGPANGDSEPPLAGEPDPHTPRDSDRSTRESDKGEVAPVEPAIEPSEARVPAPDEAPADSTDLQPEVKEKRKFELSWDRGLRIEGPDQRFRLKVGGRLFVDIASISGDRAIESLFKTGGFIQARQARIDITGTWGTRLYYRLQVDLTGNSSTGRSRNEYLKSFFMGYVGPRWLGRAEVGVLKVPFSMGVLTSGLNTDFLERGLPTLFAPSFNPGILVRNEAFDDRLFWAFGVFRFTGSNGENNRIDVAARVGGVPWSSDDGASFVHLGASYTALLGGEFGLEAGSRPETSFGDKWVQATGIDAKNGHLVGLELAGARNGFTYQSEVILAVANRSENEDLLLWGAYTQVSYFITGERRRYLKRQGVFGRVAIKHAFSWRKRTWGAWEVTARYSYLDLDDEEIRGGIMSDFTIGLNWYLLPNFRTMANYVHAHVNGLGTGHIFSTRFQIDF